MTVEENSNNYQRGLELAEAGKHQQALECIRGHLKNAPDDPEALNDAGVILHCLNRSKEAIDSIVKAKQLQNDNPEIIWNLVEAYLTDEQPEKAQQLFDDMERAGVLNVDVLNRTADVFLQKNNKNEAIETLLRSLQISPEQQILPHMLEVIKSKRPKIALFSNSGNAAEFNEIKNFTEQRFQTHLFRHQTDQLIDLILWSDICWFDDCSDIIIETSNLAKICKNIVRLYPHQANEQWTRQVNWDNIDTVIIDSSEIKNTLIDKIPGIESKISIVIHSPEEHLNQANNIFMEIELEIYPQQIAEASI